MFMQGKTLNIYGIENIKWNTNTLNATQIYLKCKVIEWKLTACTGLTNIFTRVPYCTTDEEAFTIALRKS